jgi:hypothetical protein
MCVGDSIRIGIKALSKVSTEGEPTVHIACREFSMFRDDLCLPIVEIRIVSGKLSLRYSGYALGTNPKGSEENET